MVYGILCYLHIHYGYRRILISLAEYFIAQSHSATTGGNDIVYNEYMFNIHSQLEVWLSEKRYMQKNITINSVAKELNTNRTYLSKYVNTTYNHSFRNWISTLRLAEAKKLMLENLDAPISSIANTVGSASLESFTHIFTRLEGIPPTKWREDNAKSGNVKPLD